MTSAEHVSLIETIRVGAVLTLQTAVYNCGAFEVRSRLPDLDIALSHHLEVVWDRSLTGIETGRTEASDVE